MQREDTLLSATNENETNLILIDFLTHGQLLANNSLFIKLKNKMEAGTRWLARGFSTNFEWVHSIGTTVESSQNDFQNNCETHVYLEFPYDVKISYNQQCILITDFLTHQLLVCDLMNYSPKAYIDAPSDFPTHQKFVSQ
ncbi:hypothetical protein C9374_000749 [Naegleria lovaniensis]|uniref:Uncharacterized protein n=1 Tax=Naegleria lovaniensis TaxID=51637 RepID=A0AA88GXH4_NAELO|nr:uncharacterized protein C9374_000749 [Naegleria lovaniensis]KAG2387899.1 hypothetical protein C9374_000749 [Naegleria lovaniensis]